LGGWVGPSWGVQENLVGIIREVGGNFKKTFIENTFYDILPMNKQAKKGRFEKGGGRNKKGGADGRVSEGGEAAWSGEPSSEEY